MPRKNTLVAWSGGIDSTYILARLLVDTDDEITCIHIRMFDKEGRYKREQVAIEALYSKLKTIRPFNVIPLGMDFSNLGFKTFDMCVVGFAFGCVIRHFYGEGNQVDRLVIGTHQREGHWKKRWGAIRAMIDTHVEGANFPHDSVPLMLPEPLPTKGEEIKYLKEIRLFEDCWYCRKPKLTKGMYLPCGECRTCLEVAEA